MAAVEAVVAAAVAAGGDDVGMLTHLKALDSSSVGRHVDGTDLESEPLAVPGKVVVNPVALIAGITRLVAVAVMTSCVAADIVSEVEIVQW